MRTLIFLDYFTPAFKAGGPARIFEAVARASSDPYETSIVTRNNDLGDSRSLSSVPTDSWTHYEKAQVMYCSSAMRTFSSIRALMASKEPQAVHLNSLFSRTWTLKFLILMRLNLIYAERVFLSPHGELAISALGQKGWRKKIFLTFAKAFGLFNGVSFIATSDKEVREIQRVMGDVHVLNVPPPFPRLHAHSEQPKKKGELKLVFFARISAMKNIGYLNRVFPKIKGKVSFDIYGPIEDAYKDSWFSIFDRMRKDLGAASVNYKGAIASTESPHVLAQYDLFIQPSLTENFGYSILESLASGTPVLISDRTPWNEIKVARCGGAVSLEAVDTWIEKLQAFVDMDQNEWKEWSARATAWAGNQRTTATKLLKVYATGSDAEVGSGNALVSQKPKVSKVSNG